MSHGPIDVSRELEFLSDTLVFAAMALTRRQSLR